MDVKQCVGVQKILPFKLNGTVRFASANEPSDTFTRSTNPMSVDAKRALLDQAYQPWAQGLSSKERFACQAYTDLATPDLLNAILRDTTLVDLQNWKQVKQFRGIIPKIADLDAAIEKSALPCDLTVYRGVSHLSFTEAKKRVGQVISDPSYGSTSIDPAIAQGFGPVAFEIKLPKGTQAAWLSSDEGTGLMRGEGELLLPRGHQLKVKGYRHETFDRNGQPEPHLILEATLLPEKQSVPSVSDLAHRFSGDTFVEHALDVSYTEQLKHFNETEQKAMARLAKLCSSINKDLRGTKTFEMDMESHRKRLAHSKESSPDDYEAEIQKHQEHHESLRRDAALAAQCISKLTLPCDTTVYLSHRDSHGFNYLLEKSPPSEWVGKTLTDPGFVVASPDKQLNGVMHSDVNNKPVVFELTLPKGSPALWCDALPAGSLGLGSSSGQMLLPPNQTYQVTGVSSRTVVREGKSQEIAVVELAVC